jgi:hypothetical protein
LDEVSLAYATTIHKSQGSEYPAVVIPLAMPHYLLLERNLLYTAVTRGKIAVCSVVQHRRLGRTLRPVEVPSGYNLYIGILLNGIIGVLGVAVMGYLATGFVP